MSVENIVDEASIRVSIVRRGSDMRKLPGDVDGHGVVPEEETNKGVLNDVAWIILYCGWVLGGKKVQSYREMSKMEFEENHQNRV